MWIVQCAENAAIPGRLDYLKKWYSSSLMNLVGQYQITPYLKTERNMGQ